jgi:hypothetical protein
MDQDERAHAAPAAPGTGDPSALSSAWSATEFTPSRGWAPFGRCGGGVGLPADVVVTITT